MIRPGLGRSEPGCRIPPRHNVGLGPERRDVIRVDHVLAGHGQLDTAAQRHVQFIYLALAVRVLRAPHPLFACHEDLQRVLRVGIHLVIELRAPRENEHRDHEGDHRPGYFEFQVTFDLLGDLALAAAAIFDQKVERRHADQHGEKPRQREQEEIKQVYLEGEVRRLLREEWNLNQEWVHKITKSIRSRNQEEEHFPFSILHLSFVIAASRSPMNIERSPYNGKWQISYGKWKISLSLLRVTSQVMRLPLRRSLFLLAPQVEKERQQSRQRQSGEDSQHAHHDQAVGPTLRVVHITIKNDLIGERSDLSRRGVDHAEAQVARRVFDPVKITRDLALWRQDHNAAGVGVLLRHRVPDVTKADGLRQRLDGRLVAGQEMPAGFSAGFVIPAQIFRLLRRRQLRLFARIEAHAQVDELLAGSHRQRLQRPEQSGQHLCAEARAAVIDQRQHHRLVFEILSQLDRPPALVAEFQIERDLVVQKLIYADVFQDRRTHARRLRRCAKTEGEW